MPPDRLRDLPPRASGGGTTGPSSSAMTRIPSSSAGLRLWRPRTFNCMTGWGPHGGSHRRPLAALRLDADRVPVPRADGDREALRILLVARQEVTAACNAQGGRLRALLLAGGDADRRAARRTLSKSALAALACPLVPAANTPSAMPRSVASRSRSARRRLSGTAPSEAWRSSPSCDDRQRRPHRPACEPDSQRRGTPASKQRK